MATVGGWDMTVMWTLDFSVDECLWVQGEVVPVTYTAPGAWLDPYGVRVEPENLALCFVFTWSWVPLLLQCVPSANPSYASLLGAVCLGKNCH